MKEKPKTASDPPLQGLTNLAELLGGFTAGALVGGVIGIAVAEVLRARGRRWTWALALVPLGVAVGIGVLASPLRSWGAALGLGVAFGVAVGAVGWGAYRRIEDRRAGGDRESSARGQRGVLDAARRRVRERPSKRRETIATGIALGRTERGELALIRRGTRESGSHVLIPGATGAGKTTSLAALLVEYVARSGFGAVVIEAKIDERLRAAAQAAAAARGVGFHLVSPTGSSGYDPIAQGNVDERSERLIAVQPWGSDDADFYRQAASPFLRLVVRALDAGNGPTTLRTVAQSCDPDLLEQVATEAVEDEELGSEIVRYTAALQRDERRAIGGLRARLFNLADSDFASEWLDPTSAQGPVVDLRRSVSEREVVYFRLDTDRTGNVGEAIAQMVMLDLGAIASSIMGKGIGTFVAIDEFGALETGGLDRLYTRGRGAGMSVALGTQTVADLGQAGPATRERVGATIESIVCHRIGSAEDADWISQLIGNVPAWHTTTRTDALGLTNDEGTRSRGYRYEVHPAQLQRLSSGEAFVARLDSAEPARARSVRVVPPWRRLPRLEEPRR
jgi:hypothetical protein